VFPRSAASCLSAPADVSMAMFYRNQRHQRLAAIDATSQLPGIQIPYGCADTLQNFGHRNEDVSAGRS
jgi:hypothetical protein